MKNIWIIILLCLIGTVSAHAALVYQNFEADNGTVPPYGSQPGTPPEYGWGFGQVATGFNDENDPVHGGKRAWKITIPAGKPLQAGTGIPAQFETYNVNFIPECHDRLTFWIWSDPSKVGAHTVMVKLFDQGAYKEQGVAVWTTEEAAYRQWSRLAVPFSQLPSDFNWHRVDKIEFFNYWDGTYYYDDIEIGSTASPGQDLECLTAKMFVSCTEKPAASVGSEPFRSAILGLPPGREQGCRSVFDPQAALVLEAWQSRAARRSYVMEELKRHESR